MPFIANIGMHYKYTDFIRYGQKINRFSKFKKILHRVKQAAEFELDVEALK